MNSHDEAWSHGTKWTGVVELSCWGFNFEYNLVSLVFICRGESFEWRPVTTVTRCWRTHNWRQHGTVRQRRVACVAAHGRRHSQCLVLLACNKTENKE